MKRMRDNSVERTTYPHNFVSPIIPVISIPQQAYASTYALLNVQSGMRQVELDHSNWLSDYADDIFRTMRESELNRRLIYFRSQQSDYRPTLLCLLRLAVETHKLSRTTLHLAVYFLDYLMDTYTICLEKLNLTAIACLILSSKIEETDMNVPKFADLNSLLDNAYTIKEFKNIENKILTTFNFELMRPTAATFTDFFSKGFLTLDDFHLYLQNWHNMASNLVEDQILPPLFSNYQEMVSNFSQELFKMIDVSLDYMKFANARPSLIAASCIAAVRRLQNILPSWTPYLIELTDYTEDDLETFVEALLTLYQMNVKLAPYKCNSNSPDSGIISNRDTKSDTSGNESVEEDSEEENEPYYCADYPLLIKRRRLN